MLILKNNPKIPLYYVVGKYRYWAFYSKYFKWLLRGRVKKSIERLNESLINRECFNSASCKDCGCQVPQQNYGGKPCDCFWIDLNGDIKTRFKTDYEKELMAFKKIVVRYQTTKHFTKKPFGYHKVGEDIIFDNSDPSEEVLIAFCEELKSFNLDTSEKEIKMTIGSFVPWEDFNETKTKWKTIEEFKKDRDFYENIEKELWKDLFHKEVKTKEDEISNNK